MAAFNPIFSITNGITAGLTEIERARGFLDAATLSDQWLDQMSSRALLLEAHHTTHIEGTQLTLEQAEQIWRGDQVADADPDDVRELLNYRDAFEFVSGYLNDGGPVSEGLVREIHKQLVDGVRGGEGQPGEYRLVQNYVVRGTGEVVYTPPPATDVPILMNEMVGWINDEHEIHPVLVSGIAQFQLIHVHPFIDGNGRSSRLLSTLCLYRAGYDFRRLFSISEFYDRDRAAFYGAIQGVRDNGMDLTGWLEFFVDGLSTQMNEVKNRGARVIRRDAIMHEHGLSERQGLAIEYLLDHDEIRVDDFEALCQQANRRSLQRDLKGMADKGVIASEGAARSSHYVLSVKGL